MRRLLPLVLLLVSLVSGPAAAAPPLPDWQSPLLRDHPLVGRIWDPAAARFLEVEDLVRRLGAADLVLVGERHDNVDHHRLQAWVVAALAEAGRAPAVAFEMIPRDRAGALAAYLDGGGDAAGLGAALDWADSGWPAWPLYQPIAEAALAADLPLVAADLPRADRRQIGERGAEALPDALRATWALERSWAPELTRDLLQELSEAHCAVAPPEAFAGLAEVQRARDAAMADALLGALESRDSAVLIAGTGHTRPDRGVPWFLRARAPEAESLSLALREVEAGRTAAAAYGAQGGHDLVWFTPRRDDADPCEKFADQLERLRQAE